MPRYSPIGYSPIAPDALVRLCADRALRLPGRAIVVVDGAPPAHPDSLAADVADTIRTAGRAADVVRVDDFIRPASTRLEWGPHDTESYLTSWYDYPALRREVVDALHDHGRWLPRLWDSRRDRSFRDQMRSATEDQILVISGPMTLRPILAPDLSIALRMGRATLDRLMPPDLTWTIEPLLEFAEHAPTPTIEVRYDHPGRPAIAERV
ncbi:nucleoside/nucleotide kinase family protein [Gordonia jinhuaensis]|uniref:hypothetical protein n=1 Tax=Gordonia jinhuaensis TaxID=1517702 RepID=UPI0016689965|nr:hypothetical protein [Gordonia jinhuaensis]